MTLNNDGLSSLNDQENLKSSSNSNVEDIKSKITNDLGNTTFTDEEIEQANKPQPNVITNATSGSGSIGTVTRDTERVNERANEASDSTDTNTGGIVAGAAKGASQS
ncbi:MAG: hypothetical protein JWQ40_725 [Segetibacter sp.]|jgi:hypothetical protein|nr:hypothetical protein [Segetibacter sp.]